MSAQSKSAILERRIILVYTNPDRLVSGDDVAEILDLLNEANLNIKDGGYVVQSATGYTTLIEIDNDKQFTHKKYVDDAIASSGASAFLLLNGGNEMGADLNAGGFNVTNLHAINDHQGTPQIAILVHNRILCDVNSENFVDFSDIALGLKVLNATGYAGIIDMSAMTSNKNIAFRNIVYTGVADITDVYNAIAGLKFKEDVLAASTANVSISSAPSSLDGVSLTIGDRILLKDQTAATENGIYIFNGTGSALTRSTDADLGSELENKTVPVTQGSTNGDHWFTCTNDSITIGVTNIVFTETGGATYTGTGGVDITGTVISLAQFATYTAGAGTVGSSDTPKTAIQKLDGNIALKENSTNKATDFTTIDNNKFPTTQAVSNYISTSNSLNKKKIGTVLYNQFLVAGELSAYTNVGSASFAISSGELLISGGASTYDNYLESSYFTSLNKYRLIGRFRNITNGTGIAFGFDNLYIRIDTSAGANRGKLYIENGTGAGNTLASSTALLSFTNTTDIIEVSYRREGHSIFARVENITTPGVVELVYQGSLAVSAQSLQLISNPRIYAYGGSQSVSLFKYDNEEIQNPSILVIGDSNGEGVDQDYNAWVYLLKSNFNGEIAMQCRTGAKIEDATARIAETALINPEIIMVAMGTNNVRNSESAATIRTKYATLITALKALGKQIVIVNIPPLSNGTQNAVVVSANTDLNTDYASQYTIIDAFDALDLAGSYNPAYSGGVHHNPAGGLLMYQTAVKKLLPFQNPCGNPFEGYVTYGKTVINDSIGNKVIDFSGTSATSILNFYGSNGSIAYINLQVTSVASATSYIQIVNGTTDAKINAQGATNVGITLATKGTGQFGTRTQVAAAGTAVSFQNLTTTSGAYEFQFYSAATQSTSNKVSFKLTMNNSSGSAAVNSYITASTLLSTAGSEASSISFENMVAGVRTIGVVVNRTDLSFPSTGGTKIGLTTSEKLAFWNATPIVQPTTAIAASTFSSNTSLIANDTATFDGYTIGQIVKALRNTGLLA